MKYLILMSSLSLMVGLGFTLDSRSRSGNASPLPAEALPPQVIAATGRVEGLTRKVELRPQVVGRIEELAVREGALVASGQLLLRLESSQFEADLRLAEAGLQLAEAERLRLVNGAREDERNKAAALHLAKLAQQRQARRTWDRAEGLVKRRVMSEEDVEQKLGQLQTLDAEVAAAAAETRLLNAPPREDELTAADARIAAAKARVQLAEVQLQRTRLVAPIAGQVLKVTVEPGELTGPEVQLPSITMADTSRLRVQAFVEELDAARVQVGMTATITAQGLPSRSYMGRISELSPRMEPKELFTGDPTERFDTKTREVWIDLQQHDGLVMGLRMNVRIDAETVAR